MIDLHPCWLTVHVYIGVMMLESDDNIGVVGAYIERRRLKQ